jgi:NADH:ubiquinone oxidoreductase subunit F (NADH-binding)
VPEQHVLLKGAAERDLTRLAEYRAEGGYEALAKARRMEPAKIVDELLEANLRGRGGAFFPMGRKASFLAQGTRYLVVNADESEPGTFKDREILFSDPHRLIEGCLITAHGIGCDHVFIYIRGEYLTEFEILRAACDEARDAGLLDGVTIVIHRGAGAYICGEESADADQQRRDRLDGAGDHRDGRRRVREARRAAGLDRHARLLALRERRERRQLRAADGDDAA